MFSARSPASSGARHTRGLKLEELLPVENLPEDAEAAVPLPLVVLDTRHDGGGLRYWILTLVCEAGSGMESVSHYLLDLISASPLLIWITIGS